MVSSTTHIDLGIPIPLSKGETARPFSAAAWIKIPGGAPGCVLVEARAHHYEHRGQALISRAG